MDETKLKEIEDSAMVCPDYTYMSMMPQDVLDLIAEIRRLKNAKEMLALVKENHRMECDHSKYLSECLGCAEIKIDRLNAEIKR